MSETKPSAQDELSQTKEFSTTDLVSFGLYLLSAERSASILYDKQEWPEDDQVRALQGVFHADVENWLMKFPNSAYTQA